MRKATLLLVGGLVLAGTSGFLGADLLGASSAANPRTVTISVTNGPQGPPGPPGPAGPQGKQGPAGLECPKGFTAGELVINHPGGQTTTWTCLKD